MFPIAIPQFSFKPMKFRLYYSLLTLSNRNARFIGRCVRLIFGFHLLLIPWAAPLTGAVFPTDGSYTQDDEILTLERGKPVERKLQNNKTDSYPIQLTTGTFMRVRVEQRGVDVVVRLFDRDGKKLIEADSFNGPYGPELLPFVAGVAGAYRLEVGLLAPSASVAPYMIVLEDLRTSTNVDKTLVEAQQAYTHGADLMNQMTAESLQQAYKKFEDVLKLQQSVTYQRGEADTLVRMATIHSLFGEKQKAIEYYGRALTVWRALGDRNGEAIAINSIGQAYNESGQQRRALDYLNEALAIFRTVGDKGNQATALNNIGTGYYTLGEHDKALEYFFQAIPIHQALGDDKGTAIVLVNVSGIYESLGEFEKSFQHINQALPLLKKSGAQREEAYAVLTAGTLQFRLGAYRRALDSYGSALTLARKVGDRSVEAQALNNIGNIHDLLGEREKALDHLIESLQISRSVEDRTREAYTLNRIGLIHQQLGSTKSAFEMFSEALALMKRVADRHGEAQTLNYLGLAYTAAGETQIAVESFIQALRLNRQMKEKAEEAHTLSNLMLAWKTFGNPQLAIFYGKQSINAFQEIRTRIVRLDKDLQSSFLESKGDKYRQLVDLLISQGRLPEAQQVLQMLKDEEYFEFVRRDSITAKELLGRIDLTSEEEIAIKRYLEIADRVTTLDIEIEALSKSKAATPAEQSKIESQVAKLRSDLEAANITFNAVLRDIQSEFSQSLRKDEQIVTLAANRGLRADLREWGSNTVVLSTIVGRKRYRVILTTKSVQVAGAYDVTQEELNKLVLEFRQALQDPCACVDPRPLGQRLYEILLGPVEKQLSALQARTRQQPITLVWSLDGVLRYLPVAALWDGNRYLVERYRNVVITLASRTRIGSLPRKQWRGLGLGVSREKEIFDPALNENIKFAALPAVPIELKNVIRDEGRRVGHGVVPGRILLDDKFTAKAMTQELRGGGFSLVHLASHFVFRPGDERQSFLLLGDGNSMTLQQIRNAADLQFAGVELLTLSACETGMGGADANGKEIEGFAVLAQEQGAKAVLATLWPVADNSTQLLMTELYRQRQNNQLGKAEALRRAQFRLLNGTTISRNTARTKTRGLGVEQATFKTDPQNPYAHPFFWAPFILIGNWH